MILDTFSFFVAWVVGGITIDSTLKGGRSDVEEDDEIAGALKEVEVEEK